MKAAKWIQPDATLHCVEGPNTRDGNSFLIFISFIYVSQFDFTPSPSLLVSNPSPVSWHKCIIFIWHSSLWTFNYPTHENCVQMCVYEGGNEVFIDLSTFITIGSLQSVFYTLHTSKCTSSSKCHWVHVPQVSRMLPVQWWWTGIVNCKSCYCHFLQCNEVSWGILQLYFFTGRNCCLTWTCTTIFIALFWNEACRNDVTFLVCSLTLLKVVTRLFCPNADS